MQTPETCKAWSWPWSIWETRGQAPTWAICLWLLKPHRCGGTKRQVICCAQSRGLGGRAPLKSGPTTKRPCFKESSPILEAWIAIEGKRHNKTNILEDSSDGRIQSDWRKEDQLQGPWNNARALSQVLITFRKSQSNLTCFVENHKNQNEDYGVLTFSSQKSSTLSVNHPFLTLLHWCPSMPLLARLGLLYIQEFK